MPTKQSADVVDDDDVAGVDVRNVVSRTGIPSTSNIFSNRLSNSFFGEAQLFWTASVAVRYSCFQANTVLGGGNLKLKRTFSELLLSFWLGLLLGSATGCVQPPFKIASF